ncbi:MAG: glycosyltransferase family A protein [Thermodesulfobacteriota bacterium]
MLVSVIVPLYDKAPFVRRALASIARQTHPDVEILVVDDGSRDGGGEVAAAFGDPRLRVIRQRNAGPGSARNRGLAEARGELVAFLDADDEWQPGFLEHGLALLRAAGPDAAAAASGYVLEPGARSTRALWQRRGLRDGLQRVDATSPAPFVMHLAAYLTPCTTLARTAVLRRWGGFYARDRCVYGEDTHLWLAVLLNHPVAISLEPHVSIHTDASHLSGNLRGPRPVEPFLTDPRAVEEACPAALRDVLRDVLAISAARTACMLSYWGRWREARELLRRFRPPSAWRVPWVVTAQLAANPLGARAGTAVRFLREVAA